jgi:RNA polymerase sigma factor for flagellar operon FliA
MYMATGHAAGDDYVNRYAPLVRRMAHHLAAKLPSSVQVDDIIQAGMIGLMDAAGRYETNHGANFETFASPRIRGAMLDELRANDWIPRGVRRAQKSIERAISKLEQELKRAPVEAEVAAEMKLTLIGYHELLGQARGAQLFYYDELSCDDDAESFLERSIASNEAEPLQRLHDKRFHASLSAAIVKLPEREKQLMGMYYERDLNFREIAAVFGVTESRVCQLHTQAVARLRAELGSWKDE